MSLTGDPDIDLLQTQGDQLERIICTEIEALQLVLGPYARVWARHIFPRRVDGGAFLVEEWQPFGGCHYTALVRLHHALVAKREILELCQNAAGDENNNTQLLTIHAACAAFWDNLGASIDNFVRAREEAKKALQIETEKRKPNPPCAKCGLTPDSKEKTVARTLSQAKNPKLYYAFERRHQFIHSILVPKQMVNGQIRFNLRHFDDASTDWAKEVEAFRNLDAVVQADWDAVLSEFSNTWESFFGWLQQHDKARPNPALPQDGTGASVNFAQSVNPDVGSPQQTLVGPSGVAPISGAKTPNVSGDDRD